MEKTAKKRQKWQKNGKKAKSVPANNVFPFFCKIGPYAV